MQVSNLLQEGCVLKANFVAAGTQNNYETFPSPIFTINNAVTFQIEVIQAFYNDHPFGLTNKFFSYIKINFRKKPEDDSDYILNLSSAALNIKSRRIRNDDGSWYIIRTTITNRNEFDISVVLETVTKECSYARFAKAIIDDEVLTDFELRCGDSSVKVHKVVLAMSSPVLRRELEGDWRETKQGYMDIPDTSRATLQHFKNYMYRHELPDTGVERLLLLSSYYMMPELEQKCLDKLRATVTTQNALSLLDFASMHQITKLQLAVLECIESGMLKVKELEKEKNKRPANLAEN